MFVLPSKGPTKKKRKHKQKHENPKVLTSGGVPLPHEPDVRRPGDHHQHLAVGLQPLGAEDHHGGAGAQGPQGRRAGLEGRPGRFGRGRPAVRLGFVWAPQELRAVSEPHGPEEPPRALASELLNWQAQITRSQIAKNGGGGGVRLSPIAKHWGGGGGERNDLEPLGARRVRSGAEVRALRVRRPPAHGGLPEAGADPPGAGPPPHAGDAGG